MAYFEFGWDVGSTEMPDLNLFCFCFSFALNVSFCFVFLLAGVMARKSGRNLPTEVRSLGGAITASVLTT